MLMSVIQNRYEESGSLLAVASITANVSITTSAGLHLGFGDKANYSGNLVPFSAGAVYEENPTISYTPVVGAEYARQIFSPVSIAVLSQLTGTLADPAHIYAALVSSVNGIRNPDFQYSTEGSDQDFGRVATIMTRLTQAHRLPWVENRRKTGSFSIFIDDYAPAYTAEMRELLNLVGVPAQKDRSAQVIPPVSLALDGRGFGGWE